MTSQYWSSDENNWYYYDENGIFVAKCHFLTILPSGSGIFQVCRDLFSIYMTSASTEASGLRPDSH
jgi:hypothetical protein